MRTRIYCNNTTQCLNGAVIIDDILEAKKNIRNSNRLRDFCHASELDSVLSTDKKGVLPSRKERAPPLGHSLANRRAWFLLEQRRIQGRTTYTSAMAETYGTLLNLASVALVSPSIML